MLEDALADAIDWSGAEGGTIIVMDPETGELKGMAATPTFDPNKYWEYEESFPGITPYNRAIGYAYEPGSVFKVITMAAALDSGVVDPSTTYTDSSGVYWVDGAWPIYNWDGGAWGEQNMTGCMQHSLNVCLAHIARGPAGRRPLLSICASLRLWQEHRDRPGRRSQLSAPTP